MTSATIEPVGSGLSSLAWRVDDASGDAFVLRVPVEGRGETTYVVEHAIMAVLHERGASVPRPVAGDETFSLTTFVRGANLRPDDHLRAAPAIAAFLRVLHGLPVTGYGLVRPVDGQLTGAAADGWSGALGWNDGRLWPFDGTDLSAHPALARQPALRRRLADHVPGIRAAMRDRGVLVHTDLHEENLLDDDGHISVIDFGEAFIAPAAWEFGALAYFLGWPLADAVLDVYLATDGSPPVEWARRRSDAAALGLAWGVHRWRQDRDLGEERDAEDEAFLHATLDAIREP